MRKFTLLMMSLLLTVGAMAQTVYEQKINHVFWTVKALNEAGTSGNEGGVAHIADADSKTFYHSNWGSNYEGGTSGVNKGQDGLQAFMVELPMEYTDISKISYTGRSDKSGNNPSGWATKVRIYLYQTLPEALSAKALNDLTYVEKEALLAKTNSALGNPVFDNNENPWASNSDVKIAEFTAQTAKYILFVMDASTDGWLTCSDFNIYYNVTLNEGVEIKEVVTDKPYYLKIKNAACGECYLDIKNPHGDNQGLSTVGRNGTPVAAYFTLVKGAWHLSTEPGHVENFLGISQWCATPQSVNPVNYFIEYNADGTINLSQDSYKGDGLATRSYLGGNAILTDANQVKLYTDADKANAVKIELVDLTDLEAAKESARVALVKKGPGFPAIDSEARTTLEDAMNADGADAESVNAAVEAYKNTYNEATEIANVALPAVGKVYRFVSANPEFLKQQFVRKAMYNNGTQLMWQNYNKTAINQMWAVMDWNAETKKVTFINLNDARSPQGDFLMRQTPDYCTLAYLGEGQFNIKSSNGGTMHANGHGGGAGNASNIVSWGGEANSASAWYIEEVDVTKEMIIAFAGKIDAAYAQSCMLKNRSTELAEAASAVKNAADDNYASKFVELMTALKNTEIDYIDEGYFYMKSKGSSCYAYNNNNEDIYAKQEKTTASILKFVKANDGTYYIQTDCGLYVQGVAATNAAVRLNTTPVDYRVERLTSSDHYVLRRRGDTDSYHYMHQATSLENKVVGWSTDADNTQWSLEPLTAEELEKIYTVEILSSETSTLTYNKEEYAGNKVVKQSGGFYVLDAAPAKGDFTATEVEEPKTNDINVYDKKVILNSGYNSKSVYILRNLKHNQYVRYNSGVTINNNNMLQCDANLLYESLFFVEEGEGEFEGYYTIRPLAAPDKYAYNLGTDNADSRVATKAAPEEGGLTGEYYWKISSFGENAGNITPYTSHVNDDETTVSPDIYGWNRRGANNTIGYWEGGNGYNDNKWCVRTVDEEITPRHTEDDSTIGWAKYESVLPIFPYTRAVNASSIAAVKTIIANGFEMVAPKVGRYYRLKNYSSGNYISGNANDVKLLAAGKEAASTIFYIDENNALLFYNSGKYLDCYNKRCSDDAKSGKFGYAYGGAKANVITYYNNGAWTYGAGNDGAGLDRGTSNPDKDGYSWAIEEVESLPVTVTSAGYATFYTPVELVVPTGSTVTAHTVTVEGEYAILSDALTTIPANTGVILANEGTANFTINNSGTAEAIAGNLMAGTVAKTLVRKTANTEYYVLSKPEGAKEAGMYVAVNGEDETTFYNGSHKAYLEVAGSNNVSFYGFRFGGEDDETTGVEKVEVVTENAVIFDLAGRRVSEITTPGIYIIDGKKVLVK